MPIAFHAVTLSSTVGAQRSLMTSSGLWLSLFVALSLIDQTSCTTIEPIDISGSFGGGNTQQKFIGAVSDQLNRLLFIPHQVNCIGSLILRRIRSLAKA